MKTKLRHNERLQEAWDFGAEVQARLAEEGVEATCWGSLDWRDDIVVKINRTDSGLLELLRSFDFSRVEDRGVCIIVWK